MRLTAVLFAAGFAAAAFAPFPASADEFTPAQKQELGAFIRDYLVSNPDVLKEAIRALDEHWDGRGQPRGLRGTEIPLAARVLCLAQTGGKPKQGLGADCISHCRIRPL